MKPNKIQFHEEMGKWESDFAYFKKLFPKNYGAMVRKYLPLFLILMSMMLFYCAMLNASDVNLLLLMISPVMFMLAVVLARKKIMSYLGCKHIISVLYRDLTEMDIAIANYLNLQKQISTAEHNYSIYPDVMEYLKKFKASVEAEQKHKKSIIRNFWIIFCGFFVIYGSIQYYNKYSTLFKHRILSDFYQVLELEDGAPFLILEPYKTNIDDSMTIESNKISLYLTYTTVSDKENETKSGTVRYLYAQKPIIADGGTSDLRLTITDENGNPIPRCPCFVFAHYGYSEEIDSEYFLYTPKASDDLSELQTLETMRYLKANQEHLRFLVEKI